MNERTVLAEDKIGKCRYVVSVTGSTLRVDMTGYGLTAQDTQPVTRKGTRFNYDAAKLTEKMVTLDDPAPGQQGVGCRSSLRDERIAQSSRCQPLI